MKPVTNSIQEKKNQKKITARAQMLPAGTTEYELLKLAMGVDSSILFYNIRHEQRNFTILRLNILRFTISDSKVLVKFCLHQPANLLHS